MTRRKFILFLIAFSALIPEVSRTANSPIPQTPARGIVVAAGGGGDLTWTELTQGSDTTTEPTTTASITPAANDDVFMAIGVAVEGGGTTGDSDSMTVSGCSLTWTQIGRVHYGAAANRRSVYLWHGKGASPTTGSITIDFTSGSGSTWTEHAWSVDQVDNAHTTTPYSNFATANNNTGVTSLTVTIPGTVDAGDHTYFAICHETNEAVTLEAGLTSLSAITGGTDIRTLDAAYDGVATIDQTPSASWTTSSTCAAVGCIVEKAP